MTIDIFCYCLCVVIIALTIISSTVLIIEAIKFKRNPVPKLMGKGEEELFEKVVKKGYVQKMYKVEHGR